MVGIVLLAEIHSVKNEMFPRLVRKKPKFLMTETAKISD